MPVDAKQIALTAINEAITALDYDTEPDLPSDEATTEAMTILLDARKLYTDKPWPEFQRRPYQQVDAWVEARAAEQKADGRQ